MASASQTELADLEAGLDALEQAPSERSRRRGARWFATTVLPPLGALGLLVLFWQIQYWRHVKPDYALPSPATTFVKLGELLRDGDLTEAIWTSVSRGVVGFVISVAIATPFGLVMARVRVVRAALRPLISGLQTLPSVAWVPFTIILFGLSNKAIYAVILLGAVPSIANGMVSGIDQVPPLFLRVGHVLGARRLTLAWHVLLPAALPGYLAGLKQGWAFAWRSLMAAELIARSPKLGLGLGQLLDEGRQISDMPTVISGIIGILVVGIAIDLLFFSPVERFVLRRRGLLTH